MTMGRVDSRGHKLSARQRPAERAKQTRNEIPI